MVFFEPITFDESVMFVIKMQIVSSPPLQETFCRGNVMVIDLYTAHAYLALSHGGFEFFLGV